MLPAISSAFNWRWKALAADLDVIATTAYIDLFLPKCINLH
jgi:hypothetical protein